MLKEKNPCIVGIDPGSQVAGVACIISKKLHPLCPGDFEVLDLLTLDGRKIQSFNERLACFHNHLFSILKEYHISHSVFESSFIGINPQSAIKLGAIRGSLMASCARHHVPIFELSPTKVKKIITGNGHASKEEVKASLQSLLNYRICPELSFDASDALAIALSFGIFHHWQK